MNTAHQSMGNDMQQCIQECLNCHSVCLTMVAHCLQMGGEHAAPAHIGLLLDCAEICQTSANFMLRDSQFHTRTCGTCADVCEQCAQDCERLGSNDSQMQTCTDACRRCADSCRRMATMAA